MPKNAIMKAEPEEKILYYEVVNFADETLFIDPCYAICNSFICRNQIQGVRPKVVYK